MDMKKKSLKLLLDSEEKEIYSEINIEKPLFPAVFLRNQNDSVEISDYYQEYKQILKNNNKSEKKEKKEENNQNKDKA